MKRNQTLKKIDGILDKLAEPLTKILYYIDPKNAVEEKEKFVKSKTYEPNFEYKPLEFDPTDLKENIEALNIKDSTSLGRLFKTKKEDLITTVRLLEARGCSRFKDLSVLLYGKPDEQLLEEAKELIYLDILPEEKTLTSQDAKRKLEESLEDYDFKNWTIILDKDMSADAKVVSQGKEIYIKLDSNFSEQQIERLKVHEIGTHALRVENGALQPYFIFQRGTSNYLPTEEGLTVIAEERAGVLNNRAIRSYAARVLAVDLAVKGATFRETYKNLLEKGVNQNDAYTLTQRAFRGGGFIKDHIYLQGARDVKKFLAQGRNLDVLLIGKIGLQDYTLVEEMLNQGELVQAKYKFKA